MLLDDINDLISTLKLSVDASAVFLIDNNGFMLTGTDTSGKFDLESIASLSAGNYLTGKELAKLFYVDDFQSFFLSSSGKVDYLQIGGDKIFLAILHPKNPSVDYIVTQAKIILKEIAAIYQQRVFDIRGKDFIIDRKTSVPSHRQAAFPSVQSDSKSQSCSFCGKPKAQVRKLILVPGAAICDNCIKTGYEIVCVEI